MQNLTATRGDTIPFTLDQIVDLAGATVTSLAGWKVFFTVKAMRSDLDDAAVVSKSTVASTVTVAAGTATWEITPAESAAMYPGHAYAFDVQLVDPTGRVMTPVSGTLTLSMDATLRTT